MKVYRNSSGLSVVEIIVAAAILLTVVTAAAGAWQAYIRVSRTSSQLTQAALMSEETQEAIEIMRDTSWDSYIAPLTLNTTYNLYWTGSLYQATTTAVTVQGLYVRTFVLSAVSRDSSDNIAASGTVDPNTRKATIAVSLLGATSTPLMQSEMLIHNVYDN